MTTTTEPKKRRPRRTHKDVETAAYLRGRLDGREEARQEFESAWALMSKNSNDLLLENMQMRDRLARMSVRTILWSRIKGLFARKEAL